MYILTMRYIVIVLLLCLYYVCDEESINNDMILMKKRAMEDQQTTLDAIDYLAALLEQARRREAEAEAHRESIEERLVDMVGRVVEGIQSQQTNNYRVKTVSTLKRRLNQDQVVELINCLGTEIFSDVFCVKYDLDEDAFFKLKAKNYNKFMMILNVLTTAPTKTVVDVEKLH